ncbi:MAG: ATP-binding protein [Nitrospiraceae bacterium]|nr:ATP-binding protein [Nitrospiraceae bacterium]
MSGGHSNDDKLEFVVGSEVRLAGLLDGADAAGLLRAAKDACAGSAAIAGENGAVLVSDGIQKGGSLPEDVMSALSEGRYKGEGWDLSPVYIEGELSGYLYLSSNAVDGELLSAIACISSKGLDVLLKNTMRRMLAAELHTTVVNQSYEELLESNKKLSASEKKYRELAATLEQKVQERTEELRKAHMSLLQREKMASVGQLAAGMAHEINNPMGFIYSNLNSFSRYVGKLEEVLAAFRKAARGSADCTGAEELYRKLKIDFILADSRELISQSLSGAERIKKIVLNLKNFSHVDEMDVKEIDINGEIENTLSVLSYEIKKRGAEIVKDYGPLPSISGNPRLVCQVFLNLLLNALESRQGGLVVGIKTEKRGETARITVSDNGVGIPRDIQGRVFEPFFTTMEVGRGTGMGLAVVYDIVTRHGGSIEIQSEEGKGAAFMINLPLKR